MQLPAFCLNAGGLALAQGRQSLLVDPHFGGSLFVCDKTANKDSFLEMFPFAFGPAIQVVGAQSTRLCFFYRAKWAARKTVHI